MPWLAVGPLTLLMFALGVLFGAAEVATVAFAEEEGHQGAAGFLLALWALGSLVAGLISGAIAWRQGPRVRLRWGALGMVAAMAPLVLVPSIPVMGLVLLIGGLRDLADPHRRDVAGRAGAAARPADRGDDAPADRHRARSRAWSGARRASSSTRSGRRRPTWCRSAAVCSRSSLHWRRGSPLTCGPMARSQVSTGSSTTWRNWSGLESASGLRAVTPESVDDVVAEVRRAAERGETVKVAGTGHSFTGIARPEHTVLLPGGLTGITAVDRDAMTVTALAGTQLKVFNAALEELGLSLHNMGDIAEQTLAGAISTGTHGTGGRASGLAAQVVGLELVTGGGEVLRASATENAEILDLARVGLGALGVLVSVTFAVEPLFLLRAEERPLSWDEGLATFDEIVADHDHVDMYWFPHTDRLLSKRNTRMGTDLSKAEPLPRWRHRLDDDFLSNTVFGLQTAALNRAPRAIPAANRFASRLLGPAHLHRHRAPGLHHRAAGGLPRDGVRRPA